jgi:LuxR family transcriptional regulator, quorum-sensing system regulator BjaR1
MPRVWDQAYQVVEDLRMGKTEADMLSALNKAAGFFEYEHFFVTGLPEQRGESLAPYTLLSGWPEAWNNRYIENGYLDADPVVYRMRRSSDPLMWDEAPFSREDAAAARVMNEAPDFGLVCGLSIPIHSIQGFTAGACFSARHRVRWMGQRRAALQLIAIFAHSRTASIVAGRGGEAKPSPRLSPREIEVIKWSSAGKSAWDISKILNISEDTVYEYIGNAQRKLGAANRTHAVAQAMRHGLIF